MSSRCNRSCWVSDVLPDTESEEIQTRPVVVVYWLNYIICDNKNTFTNDVADELGPLLSKHRLIRE